jgi:DNA-binding response OmpR family regulator
VLLVEDNGADVFLIREAMKSEGIAVEMDIAEDGEQAISVIRRIDENPQAACHDCFLIDLNIPRCSGDEVLQTIRSSQRCASRPVIMITSSQSRVDRERAMSLGATEFFVKPFELSEFRSLARLVRRVQRGDNGFGNC